MTKPRKKKRRQKITGLKSARFLKERPHYIPEGGSTKPAQKAGLRYEDRVAKFLAAVADDYEVKHGAWIEYEDRYGFGVCQPDIILVNHTAPLVIVECKLTATKSAFKQLRDLYLPCVAEIYKMDRKDIRLVQICRNLTKRFVNEFMIDDVDEIFDGDAWQIATLQLRPPA